MDIPTRALPQKPPVHSPVEGGSVAEPPAQAGDAAPGAVESGSVQPEVGYTAAEAKHEVQPDTVVAPQQPETSSMPEAELPAINGQEAATNVPSSVPTVDLATIKNHVDTFAAMNKVLDAQGMSQGICELDQTLIRARLNPEGGAAQR